MRSEDIPRCVEIEKQVFAEDSPWSERAFQSELDAGHFYVAAKENSDVVGYAGLGIMGRPGDYEASIHNIAVDATRQGQGIGQALLAALLARADEFSAATWLEVRVDNAPAIALYEKYGFERVGVRKRYYQPSGMDAITMTRPSAVKPEVTPTLAKKGR